MLRSLRFLGACLALLLVAARVEAASVTLAWDPNSEADLARYYVGYRTSPTGSETLVNVGNVTTWTLSTATAGSTYYFRVYAENTSGLRSAPSNEVSTVIPTTPPPPSGGGLALERGALNFGAVQASSTAFGAKTPSQRVLVSQTASGAAVAWSALSVGTGSNRISVSPTSGSGTAPITVSLAPTSLAPGTYTNTVRVTVGTTQLDVPVTTRVYSAGGSRPPVGYFDTPTNGVVNVAGSLPVTGWAVDDIGVARVDIYRDAVGSEPAGAQILLGSASLVSGSRSDIEGNYPDSPLNYRAGWGFMVLTNMLPDLVNGRATGGNGSFRLHVYAIDTEGVATYLGAKNFQANNAASVKPFGTIDTPAQGGTASGSAYMVWGWAISPRGTIPTNGSTITVYVDGTARGNPTYNNNRSDIAGMFPGYANSNGAIGFLPLNTTTLANGTHTISWVVTDNLGNTEGIGSRFFTVQNGTVGADVGWDGRHARRWRSSRLVTRSARPSKPFRKCRRTSRSSRSRKSRPTIGRRSSSSRSGPARFACARERPNRSSCGWRVSSTTARRPTRATSSWTAGCGRSPSDHRSTRRPASSPGSPGRDSSDVTSSSSSARARPASRRESRSTSESGRSTTATTGIDDRLRAQAPGSGLRQEHTDRI